MAATRLDFLGLSGNKLALQFADRQRTANHRAGYLTLEAKPPSGATAVTELA